MERPATVQIAAKWVLPQADLPNANFVKSNIQSKMWYFEGVHTFSSGAVSKPRVLNTFPFSSVKNPMNLLPFETH